MASSYKVNGEPIRLPARSVLSDETHDAIMELLLNHELAPGESINIDRLAQRLEVSRTPVREALARLESEDLVAKKAPRGYAATPLLTPEQVDDLFQFRATIEPWSAAQAARHHTADDAQALRTELAAGSAAMELEVELAYPKMSEHDARFHGIIAKASGNEYARDAFERTHCHLHMFRLYQNRKAISDAAIERGEAVPPDEVFGLYFQSEIGFLAYSEHAKIAQAILAKNAQKAHDLMLEHVTGSRERNLVATRRLSELLD